MDTPHTASLAGQPAAQAVGWYIRIDLPSAGRAHDPKDVGIPTSATNEVPCKHEGLRLSASGWLHRIWYPARREAGLDWLQFHDLRRANATGLVLEGVDLKTAQTRLGHSDPRLTLGVYAQATTEADRAAADKLGQRFLPRPNRDRGRGRRL